MKDDWTADRLRSLFGGATAGTVGLEEELLLVERDTWMPVDVGGLVKVVDDVRVKRELPAAQLEVATSVHHDVPAAVAELRSFRQALAAACTPDQAVVATPVHPLVDRPVPLCVSDRAADLQRRYGEVLGRQLVSSLQVHLAFGDADCALAVFHGLRDLLPELTALAAAAPYAAGRDTGLCSARPVIATQLPRQGVPPAIASWEQFADDLNWAVGGGAVSGPSEWWWELRPHLRFGTLELRVLDVQPTVDRTDAIVRFVHALAGYLTELHRQQDLLPPAPTARIAENRWAALRDGVDGDLLDLRTGARVPTRKRLHLLIDRAEPYAEDGLDDVRSLVEKPLVAHLRRLGPDRVVPWLAEVFAE